MTRSWYIFPTAVLAGILEIMGWMARFKSSENVYLTWAFEMQITCTILGPTPLLAAYFMILGYIIDILGPSYSRLSPKLYSIIFCTGDIVSLIVQGVGGGIAAAAFGRGKDPEQGGHIMLGGILFQMFCLIIFTLCFVECFYRYFTNKPVAPNSGLDDALMKSAARRRMSKNVKLMIVGLTFTIAVILVRSIYRTLELIDGWTGRIITTQLYFNVMDGAMIVLAMYSLNFIHPGFLLKRQKNRDEMLRLNSVGKSSSDDASMWA